MKRAISNIAILIIGITVGLILAEMTFRTFLSVKYQFKEQLIGMRIYPYPGLPYDMQRCSDCPIKINSLGLRGDEVSIKKSENTKRILILGDSATFGVKVIKNEETIPGRLNTLLSERLSSEGKRFEVINGGIPGYDIQEIFIHYKVKLSQLGSDIIIYNFFPNDFLNSRYTVEKVNGRPTLVRFVDASMPGLQIAKIIPEKINLFLNDYFLFYRYTLFYISLISVRLGENDLDFMDKYQLLNLKYLDMLYEEIKKSKAKFAISSAIYSFCSRCKEPLDKNLCPEEKGCIAAFKIIRFVEDYCKKNNIPYINISYSVSDMDLKDTMVDGYAHYTGKANIKMGESLYNFVINELL